VLGIIQQNQFKAQSVEDPQLMARARSLMPLDSWRTAAREEVELNRQLQPGAATTSVDELVVKAMLKWFKQDFFSWVSGVWTVGLWGVGSGAAESQLDCMAS
jgi:hypothetical protein